MVFGLAAAVATWAQTQPAGTPPVAVPAARLPMGTMDQQIAAIRNEGLNNSHVMQTLDYLCNVIGPRLDEAIDLVEKALDQALMSEAGRLRVIHGHGTGRLRDGVREHFRTHGSVASLRPADAREGGNGATILELR